MCEGVNGKRCKMFGETLNLFHCEGCFYRCIKNFYSFIDPCFTALVPAPLVSAPLVPAAFLFAALYIQSCNNQNNT